MMTNKPCKTIRNSNLKGTYYPGTKLNLQRHSGTPATDLNSNLNLTVSLISDDVSNPDPHFLQRASYLRTSIVVAGDQYGDMAETANTLLSESCKGVKAVIAKSYNSLFRQQLINAGILPLEFVHAEDFDKISLYDTLYLEHLQTVLKPGAWMIYNRSSEEFYEAAFPSEVAFHKASARIGFETTVTIG